jgi:cyclopropane fatty-acyl-phospholipid synthase-like methyltransferase
MFNDVPSPIDLRKIEDALDWSESAMIKRPWRTEFFRKFASTIASQNLDQSSRILELGSGPGYLAEHLLTALPDVSYVALDFSFAMHELARQRLGNLANRVQFIERSFRDTAWSDGLGQFDYVVTNQAVHELRHKRHAPMLHSQVRECLIEGGSYLVCDHFVGEGGMSNDQLYMSVDEQQSVLMNAGFVQVTQLMLKGGLVLHGAS